MLDTRQLQNRIGLLEIQNDRLRRERDEKQRLLDVTTDGGLRVALAHIAALICESYPGAAHDVRDIAERTIRCNPVTSTPRPEAAAAAPAPAAWSYGSPRNQ